MSRTSKRVRPERHDGPRITPKGYSSRSSYLSKIAFGVRAIEQQTDHLGPEVTRLNEKLAQAAEGLRSIDGHLLRTIEAVERREGGR